MKGKWKGVLRCISFFLILVLLLLGCSYVVTPKNNQKAFGMDMVSANGILGEKENTIDVLFVGDSESYCTFSPMRMWEQYGFTAYVCGSPLQPLFDTSRFVHQAFEKQNPKVVVMETNTIFREYGIGSFLFSKGQSYFSVLRYHNRWKNLSINDFGSKISYTWTDDYKGYQFNNKVVPSANLDYMKFSEETEEIPKVNKLALLEIKEFCEEHGAQFIFVSTPSTLNWNYKRHNSIQEFADEHDIPYLDMNLEKDLHIDWQTDTRDGGDHLNHRGAVKATDFYGKYLKEQYSFEDHKTNPEYAAWNEAFKRYSNAVKG